MAQKNKKTANHKSSSPNPLNIFSQLFSQTAHGLGENANFLKQAIPVLKLVFFIVDWNQVKKVSSVFNSSHIAFHFINKGKGTASSEILDLLGIGSNEKAVMLCLVQPESIQHLMEEVRKKLNYRSPGAGISFAVPLSAINSPVLGILKKLDDDLKTSETKTESFLETQNNSQGYDGHERRSGFDRRSGHERRGSGVKWHPDGGFNAGEEYTHDLIISAVNQGYSDELMNRAREAGAFGGTILNARGRTRQGEVKFLGISVQEEREIILILSTREKKKNIMDAVCNFIRHNNKADGQLFSLPVENVMGLSFDY